MATGPRSRNMTSTERISRDIDLAMRSRQARVAILIGDRNGIASAPFKSCARRWVSSSAARHATPVPLVRLQAGPGPNASYGVLQNPGKSKQVGNGIRSCMNGSEGPFLNNVESLIGAMPYSCEKRS